jgi:hypothetical protein
MPLRSDCAKEAGALPNRGTSSSEAEIVKSRLGVMVFPERVEKVV